MFRLCCTSTDPVPGNLLARLGRAIRGLFCNQADWKVEGNVTDATHVNDVELSDAETYFFQRCGERGIVFEQLTNESKAICLAIVSSANYIADMVAASHHDTHKTMSASESRPGSWTIKR